LFWYIGGGERLGDRINGNWGEGLNEGGRLYNLLSIVRLRAWSSFWMVLLHFVGKGLMETIRVNEWGVVSSEELGMFGYVRELLVEVNIVYGRLYKEKERAKQCGIFRFLLSWSFLGSVESVFVRMFWHFLRDVVCRY
jgi:hypothetical protein